MSYFCAKAIKIDKAAGTFTARGGDNNVFPRMDYWTGDHKLAGLLPELASGCMKFTTRSDKHIAIEALVTQYDKKLEAIFGYGAYELWSLISGTFDRAEVLKSKAYYLDKSKWTAGSTYPASQAKKLDDIVAIYDDADKVATLRTIVSNFTIDLTYLKVDTTPHILRRKWDGAYVRRVNQYSLGLTRSQDYAAKMSKLKAEAILARFDGYELLKFNKLIIAE